MPKLSSFDFASRTYQTRKMYHETQKEYAKRLGVSERSVRRWESGMRVDTGIKNPQKTKGYKKINRIEKYLRHEKKQGIQIILKDKKTGEKIYSRMYNYKHIEKMIDESKGINKLYEDKGFEFESFRVIRLKKTLKKKVNKSKTKKGSKK